MSRVQKLRAVSKRVTDLTKVNMSNANTSGVFKLRSKKLILFSEPKPGQLVLAHVQDESSGAVIRSTSYNNSLSNVGNFLALNVPSFIRITEYQSLSQDRIELIRSTKVEVVAEGSFTAPLSRSLEAFLEQPGNGTQIVGPIIVGDIKVFHTIVYKRRFANWRLRRKVY